VTGGTWYAIATLVVCLLVFTILSLFNPKKRKHRR